MNFDRLNKWMTLAANFGVLAGIVFLGVEISQNTTATQSESLEARTDRLMSITTSMIQSEQLLSAVSKLKFLDDFCNPNRELVEDLTPEERAAFTSFLYSNWIRFENAYYQFQSSNIDEFQFEFVTMKVMYSYIPWFEMFDVYQAEFAQDILDIRGVDFKDDPRCINFQ